MVRTIRIQAAVGVMLAFGTNARAEAQEAGPRVITLADARAYAREHQPQVLASLARIVAAKENAQVPRAEWLPHLGGSAQVFLGSVNTTSNMFAISPVLTIPRIGGTSVVNDSTASLQPYGSTLAAIGVNQEVFDFGRIEIEAAAADALVDVAHHDSDLVGLDIDYGVEKSYFGVLAAKKVLTASEQAYDRVREHRDYAKAGVQSGLLPPIQLTRSEADLARFDIQRIRARGDVSTSQAMLAAAVGSPDLMLDATGDLPTTSDIPSLSSALDQAAARDPRVASALARVRAQHRQTHAIFAQLRPNLTATATFSGRAGGAPPTQNADQFNGWLPTVPNWDIGLILTWPIYDGLVVAQGHTSEAQELALRDDVAALRQMLSATVQKAYIAVEVARDALPRLQQARDAAVANYEQADARFKAGLGTAVELADAEELRTAAEINLALGQFDLARARAKLMRVIAQDVPK